MKRAMVLVASLIFLAFGVYLLTSGDFAQGAISALFGLVGITAFVLQRAQQRAGENGQLKKPYLLLAAAGTGLGALIGVLYIIFTPVSYRGWMRTPTESRVFGIFLVAVCLIGVVIMIRRWAAARD